VKHVIRIFRKEITELCFRPLLLVNLLLLSCLAVWVSGQLNIERPPIRVFLYTDGAEQTEVDKAQEALGQFPGIVVVPTEGTLDQNKMRSLGASLAIIRESENWVVLHRMISLRQEEENNLVINLIASSVQSGRPWLADAATVKSATLGEVSRLAAMPGRPEHELVPRTIALLVVFLPFAIAAQSYLREVMFRTLPTLILSQGGRWASLLTAKVIVSVWLSLSIFLFILLMIRPIFGISPKPGLLMELGAQGLASIVSASLGLLAAVAARSQSQLFISGAFYFLALVLISGFLFPLETAAPAIRFVSHASPLTFSGRLLEDWLFFGTPVHVFWRDLLFLGAQVIGSAILLSGAVWLAQRRI
jgi:hypothetical protein